MKKLLLIIILINVTATSSFSQNKYLKNRFTLEYNMDYNISSYFGFDKAEHKYSDNSQVITKEFRPFYSNLILNYKIGRRLSLELSYSRKKYDALNINKVFDGGYSYTTERFPFTIKGNSYGVGLNIFYNGCLSPIGNSIGLFIKSNTFNPEDYNEYYSFLSKTKNHNYETEEQISYRVTSFVVKFNFIKMLSNKAPLFFRYGFSAGLPIIKRIKDKTVSTKNFESYSEIDARFVSLDDVEIMDQFSSIDYFKIFFGLGIYF